VTYQQKFLARNYSINSREHFDLMKELVVISGKGGTGKTSVLASFAALSKNTVLADCDVDAADLYLLLKPQTTTSTDFISGKKARIEDDKCTKCGICYSLCHFDAIKEKTTNWAKSYFIDELACEGCGLCKLSCPEDAIIFGEEKCGRWFISDTQYGRMVHARLNPGAGNSGRLVTMVKNEARKIAQKKGLELVLVDGPPGTGCPVIASIAGASMVLAVTEPTYSGVHDLNRVLELTRHFKIPAAVCVNKWDINPKNTDMIKESVKSMGAMFAGCIPYDSDVTRAQILARPLVDCSNGYAAVQIKRIWEEVCQMKGM
jgi:MinD superfamily P-loop ATPase